MTTVKEQDLLQVLKWLRDLRFQAIKKRLDPWAVRQGLLLILNIDTKAALERGISMEQLEDFDRLVEAGIDTRAWATKGG